jgi:hypothetical protein
MKRGLDSLWSLGALGLALSVGVWLHGCRGQVGACSGKDCPQLPGCEGSSPILCDPEHVCAERVCEGVGWICGVDASGNYAWSRSSAPCDDQDPCTVEDACVNEVCVGKPLECTSPPANSCKDSATLVAWDSTGLCEQGSCRYGSQELPCGQGCDLATGKCSGAPCVGVTCDKPPGPCFKKPGVCSDGTCRYDPLPLGSSCTPSDPCVESGTCDDSGACNGKPKDCARPHTLEGSCFQGACQGYKCEAGWGNCNPTWEDGCETALTSVEHCGSCTVKCPSGAHSTATCSGGKCGLKCDSPYADCDGNAANGCEIPVGKANVCNRSGLASFSGTTPPCGTAHCGPGSGSNVKSFGSWHCTFCEHCHKFSNGYSWCLGGDDGNFSPSRCASCCNDGLTDKVCN